MKKLWALVFGWNLVLLLVGVYVWSWVRDRYSGRGPIPYSAAGILHNPLRRLVHPVRRTLEQSHVAPGATVLELGPGTGYFSIEASRIIGAGGRLLCLDLQRPMLVDLAERLRDAGVSSAHLVMADATHLPLADDSVDTSYLVTVIGEVPDRPAALAELRRVLRSGGVLSFTESLTDPDYQLEDGLRDVCRATGFQPLEHIPGLLGYTMNFAAP